MDGEEDKFLDADVDEEDEEVVVVLLVVVAIVWVNEDERRGKITEAIRKRLWFTKDSEWEVL